MKNTGRPYNAQQRESASGTLQVPLRRFPEYASVRIRSRSELHHFRLQRYQTVFDTQNLKMNDDELEVTVKVTNSGDYAGEEVVQLYIRQLVASTTRPVKELKGFQKIHFEKGESKDVTFTLTAEDLAFYRGDMTWGSEAGDFHVFVGTASDNVQKAEFKLVD